MSAVAQAVTSCVQQARVQRRGDPKPRSASFLRQVQTPAQSLQQRPAAAGVPRRLTTLAAAAPSSQQSR